MLVPWTALMVSPLLLLISSLLAITQRGCKWVVKLFASRPSLLISGQSESTYVCVCVCVGSVTENIRCVCVGQREETEQKSNDSFEWNLMFCANFWFHLSSTHFTLTQNWIHVWWVFKGVFLQYSNLALTRSPGCSQRQQRQRYTLDPTFSTFQQLCCFFRKTLPAWYPSSYTPKFASQNFWRARRTNFRELPQTIELFSLFSKYSENGEKRQWWNKW